MSDEEMLRRAHAVNLAQASDETTLAVFGLAEPPKVEIGDLFEKFDEITGHKRKNKSKNQLRIWSHPFKRSLATLETVIGQKAVEDLTRGDALALHKHLNDEINAGNLKTNSANRLMGCLSSMHTAYAKHYQLDLPFIFRGLNIAETDSRTRDPIPEEWIRMLLQPGRLDGLNRECQAMLKVVINTGVRPSEVIGAMPHHFRLDHNIPHFQIRAEGREVKTADSERDVPLLGCALEAMREFPNGLERYRVRPTGALANTNKFLKFNDLMPKDDKGKHLTVYSFRHSFQDRLTALELPDRLSKTLMGHKVDGQKYGSGPTLEHLARVLEPISF